MPLTCVNPVNRAVMNVKNTLQTPSIALGCPSWSKGEDLRSSTVRCAWVQIPPLAYLFCHQSSLVCGMMLHVHALHAECAPESCKVHVNDL